MPGKVIDRDFGFKALSGQVRSLGGSITVGIHAEDNKSPGDGTVSIVDYAFWNEFGTEDGRVPERSFLRSTIDENRDKYARRVTNIAKAAVVGKVKASVGLRLLAAEMEADVRNKIRDLKEPPNKPMTIARKKSDNPLIDKGFMRRAVRGKLKEIRGGTIGDQNLLDEP